MQDKIVEIIKKGIEPESLVLAHEAKIDQGTVIRLVMEIPFPEKRGDIPGGFDHRILDDGYAVVHDPKGCRQHRTVSDQPQDSDNGSTYGHKAEK